jgi:hypothetical protein
MSPLTPKENQMSKRKSYLTLAALAFGTLLFGVVLGLCWHFGAPEPEPEMLSPYG